MKILNGRCKQLHQLKRKVVVKVMRYGVCSVCFDNRVVKNKIKEVKN